MHNINITPTAFLFYHRAFIIHAARILQKYSRALLLLLVIMFQVTLQAKQYSMKPYILTCVTSLTFYEIIVERATERLSD